MKPSEQLSSAPYSLSICSDHSKVSQDVAVCLHSCGFPLKEAIVPGSCWLTEV